MFPNPVNSFSRFLAQVATVKITAKEQNITDITAIVTPELSEFNGFFRLGNIWLPQVRFVGIDWHGISCY
jgi:hypothetical protein